MQQGVAMQRLVLAAGALLLLASGGTAYAGSLEGSRPNVILIITDDQGYGPIGRHGHPWIRTPNLDAMYDRSVRFDRFLVSPTCAPTRAALMTGAHPMRVGVTHTLYERERLALSATTLPQVLRSAGYATAIFGKWHLGDEDPYQPNQRGFDEAFIHGAGGIGQAYDCSCADAPGNEYHNPVVRHNGVFVETTGFCTDVFFQAALGWIKSVKDDSGPFFAYISTNAPHDPFVAPRKNRDRFARRGFDKKTAGFYGMIENLDENVGLLFEKLHQWNLEDDTVVIFMSDNGMSRGAGEVQQQLGALADGTPMRCYNAGMKGIKGSADEGGVRAPFLIQWGDRLGLPRTTDAVAAHIDILPTLAALAGATAPRNQIQGRSLLPLLQDSGADWPDRFLFTHQGRWPIGADPEDFKHEGFAVRNHRFRLVGREALYDMLLDPGQTTNVVRQHPGVAAQMLAAYDAWWQDVRPGMVNEDATLSPTRPYHEQYRRQLETTGIAQWNPPPLEGR